MLNSFIPLCHFHLLTNIQIFWSHCLHLPHCYSMRFTTLLNYHLIDWWCNVNFVYLLDDLILGFCYSNLTQEIDEFELASTPVLWANQLTKCASHKKLLIKKNYSLGNFSLRNFLWGYCKVLTWSLKKLIF